MAAFRRLIFAALCAGLLAGVFAAAAHQFGTVPLTHVMQALRADQWLTNQRGEPPPQRDAIKRALRDAFYVDTDEWRGMVYGQARVAALQALRGLAGDEP